MADLIKTDGEIITDVDISSLSKIQKHVGGYIEYCPTPQNSKTFMYIDEEGLLKKREYNYKASVLAKQSIVGDVVLCTRAEVEERDQSKYIS